MSRFIQRTLMTTAVLGSFLIAETAFAKARPPINRSQLESRSYSGTTNRSFGRNVSTTRSTTSNAPTAQFSRSLSFNMSRSPQNSGFVQRAQPRGVTMVMPSRQLIPQSNVVYQAPMMSAPVASAPRVISSAPVIVGRVQPMVNGQ